MPSYNIIQFNSPFDDKLSEEVGVVSLNVPPNRGEYIQLGKGKYYQVMGVIMGLVLEVNHNSSAQPGTIYVERVNTLQEIENQIRGYDV